MNKNAHSKASITASTFIMAATCMGAGILALPYAFSLTGMIFGVILAIFNCITSIYVLKLLIRLAITLNAKSYEELGGKIFPSYGRSTVAILMIILTFGCLIAYCDVIADASLGFIEDLFSTDTLWSNRTFILCFFIYVIILPLCLLSSISKLEKASFIAVFLITGFAICIVIYSIMDLVKDVNKHRPIDEDIQLFNLNLNVFEALSIICLAYCAQSSLFPIFKDLKDANYIKMKKVITNSMILVGLAYLLCGLFGYWVFGINVNGDVLKSIPNDRTFNIIRILLCIAMIFHYPVIHFGLREAVKNLLYYKNKENNKLTTCQHFTLTFILTSLSLLIALILPDLDSVFSLTGALSGFPLAFILPCIYYIKIYNTNGTALEEFTTLISDVNTNTNNNEFRRDTNEYDIIDETDITSKKFEKIKDQKTKNNKYEIIWIYFLMITYSMFCIFGVYVSINEVINDIHV